MGPVAVKKPKGLREHTGPAGAKFKQLHGTAFRCAKPDCRQPL